MTTNSSQISNRTHTIVEHVYDSHVQYQPAKAEYFSKGSSLFTEAKTPLRISKRQKNLKYNEQPEVRIREKVLGKVVPNQDGRVRIQNTTAYPHSFHAHLTMKFGNKVYVGSGALVGPQHLLTCGHNIFEKSKWADEIKIYPALNEKSAPFGRARVVKVYTFSDWTTKEDERFDMALLILNKSIGNLTGWGGLLSTGDDELSNTEINIVGYPEDKGMNQMWGMKHKFDKISPQQFEYLIDTNGGQSGSPIWIEKDSLFYIVGVHTLGGDDVNSGVRLSREKFEAIVQKIFETFKIEKSSHVSKNVPSPLTIQVISQQTLPRLQDSLYQKMTKKEPSCQELRTIPLEDFINAIYQEPYKGILYANLGMALQKEQTITLRDGTKMDQVRRCWGPTKAPEPTYTLFPNFIVR